LKDIAVNKSKVSIVRCVDYKQPQVEAAVTESVELIGGIEKFIKPNARVLLKPNLLSARSPEEGVNTHPEIVRAVATLVKQVTPHILVGDSPGGWGLRSIGKVYEKSGMEKVCAEEGLKLARFDKVVSIEGFPITAVINEVDAIISISKMKSHASNILTGAVKNTFGMVVGLHKAQCHLKAPMPDELAVTLVKVFDIARPVLSIMDGVVGMEGEGPAAGSLRNFGLILASRDAVSLDAVFSELVGMDPMSVPTTREAAERNKGIADLKRIDIAGENIEDVKIKHFKLPKTAQIFKLPRHLIRAVLRCIRFYPRINKKACRRCGLCFDICPARTIKKTKDNGYKIDIKGCVHCFCCYEVCPYKAITLSKSLLGKVIMRG